VSTPSPLDFENRNWLAPRLLAARQHVRVCVDVELALASTSLRRSEDARYAARKAALRKQLKEAVLKSGAPPVRHDRA
jgi:hypothetical protein